LIDIYFCLFIPNDLYVGLILTDSNIESDLKLKYYVVTESFY